MTNRLLKLSWLICVAVNWQSSIGIAGEEAHICRYCTEATYQQLAADGEDSAEVRKYAPSRNVDLLHLKLDVTPDFQRRTVAGTATLEFAPIAKPLDELQLDAVDLNITAVRASVPIADYTSTREHLTVTFAEPLAVGQQCSLEVEYSAEPREGLYYRTSEMGYPEEDTHLFTQGEPQKARHWFPCHDYPNERCTTEIVCHVPAAMTVLSNGRLVGEEITGDGTKSVHWRQEQPHACYLVTLVAGHLAKLEDLDRRIPLAFYTQPTVAEHAANSFQDTADIMEFFEQEIGVPFPWNKYFQVTVRDFQFGGMENTSMTTLAHRTIFTTATENIRSGRKLDAHEMAHQWFGDYVTCKDWSHLWLNEGFATYYSHLYEGHKYGRDALLYDLYRDATGRVLPQQKDRRPIVYNRYDNPMEQFDFRAYPKGSWVLHMLRSQLGETLYREVVRTYLERHAFTSVTTADFVKVIEELSGRSFDQFFDQWVYHPSHPSLKVQYKWLAKEKMAQVTVTQTQATDDEILLFEFPTALRFLVDDQQVDHPITISQKKHEFYVPLAAQPTVVRFDPEFTVLADVDFDKSDKLLKAQLRPENDVIGRILAVKALAKRKTKDSLAAVGTTLREDPFFGVRVEAAKALANVKQDEAFTELSQSIAAEDARVRLEVVEGISKFFSSDAEELLIRLSDEESNPAIIAEVIRALGKYRTPEAQAIVHQNLNSQSFRNELASAAVDAIAMQRNENVRELIIKSLQARGQELTTDGLGSGLRQLASISRQLDDEPKSKIEQLLRDYLQHPKRRVQTAAIDALGTLGDGRSKAVLAALADDESRDPVARAASRALKKLQDETPLAPKEVSELRKKLTDLQKESKKLREELDELKALHEAKNGEKDDEHVDTDQAAKGEADK